MSPRGLFLTRAVSCMAVLLPLAAEVRFKQEPDRILVEIDRKPYTSFYLAPGGNKPYMYPLSTASGLVVTRYVPMENFQGETKDHPHQRGLFFAHGDINGINFWATEPNMETPKKGRMQLVKVTELKGGDKSGIVQALFEGQNPSEKPIMEETRMLTFYPDPKLRIIDYEIEIDPLEKLTVGDTKKVHSAFAWPLR